MALQIMHTVLGYIGMLLRAPLLTESPRFCRNDCILQKANAATHNVKIEKYSVMANNLIDWDRHRARPS